MSKTQRVTLAEVETSFEGVLQEAGRIGADVIVEKDGKAIARVTPLRAPIPHAGARIAEVIGMGGEEGEAFYELMQEIVRQRSARPPREVPVPEVDEPAVRPETDD